MQSDINSIFTWLKHFKIVKCDHSNGSTIVCKQQQQQQQQQKLFQSALTCTLIRMKCLCLINCTKKSSKALILCVHYVARHCLIMRGFLLLF